jgi:hypothetical protein
MNLIQRAIEAMRGTGKSASAEKRRKNADRVAKLHDSHAVNGVIQMSDGARYRIAADGSYRRITPVGDELAAKAK